MKKSLVLLAFSLALAVTSFAQTRIVNTGVLPQGQFLDFGGQFPAGALLPTASDSLQVTDSLAYIIPLSHTNKISGYMSWYWNKIGAGTATIALTFLQGNSAYDLQPLKAGVAQTTYTKSYTLSASGFNEVNFARDSVRIDGRYLKVYFITTSTASVKGKLFCRLKTNLE